MRKPLSLTAIIICLILSCTKAQYVNIPDVNFRNILQSAYPACFNASGQMDTTCAAILTEDTFSLPPLGSGIATLDGIQYFKSLQVLNFFYANVNYVPALPASLKKLTCMGNYLPDLPTLPPALEGLDCSECQLITSLPALPSSLKILNCSRCPLTSLPLLPPSLVTLDCSGCSLTSMPALPSSVTRFDCSNNRSLSVLPALPLSLQFADISYCSILTIPAPLPEGLKELDCSSNNIAVLPGLPNVLERLKCSSNPVASLPLLPSSLLYMECSYNRLTSLPALPGGLSTLNCYSNFLTALPALPAALKDFRCGRNQFGNYLSTIELPDSLVSFYCEEGYNTALPLHFPASLRALYCQTNQLTQLPALPPLLGYLNCSGNQLSSLPDLPTVMEDLDCRMNNIFCLPKLPDSTSNDPFYLGLQVSFDADKIKCLPNRPGRINLSGYSGVLPVPSVTNLPLCSPVNNVNQCQAFPVISGTVFYDNNLNGVKDANENYRPNLPMLLSNGNITYTNKNGYFEINADSLRTYTITATIPSYFNAVPASKTYTFTNYDTIVAATYALQANTSLDSLSVIITPINWAARPGFAFAYLISYENLGTTVLSPTVQFSYDGTRLSYDSASNAAVVHTNNNLALPLGTFTPGDRGSFIAYFTLNPTTPIGDTLLSVATITNGAYNNTDNNATGIRGSFDPNDKQATPQLSPLMVTAGNYIDYTIRFQNTGTDTAFTIVITDTLTGNLKANTLQTTGSSHNCKATVKGNVVYFEFINILLPDSNVNEFKSHGFVSFRIQPQTTVAANSTITNKAAIYFDYNAPVITNTAGTLIKEFTVVPLRLVSFSAVPQTDNTITLYWITANEINTKQFTIEKSSDGSKFIAVGNLAAKGNANNDYSVNVTDINNSIVYYRLKMIDNDGSFSYSPVIKIDRRKNTSGISIMTNPVKDFIIVNSNDRSLSNTQCNIINSQGATVKSFVIKEGSQAVDIKGLSTGIYYLKTISGSSKILVQH